MATKLPDGTAVVHPPGKRAVVPKGSGAQKIPNVAAGTGTASKDSSSLPPRQAGRTVSPLKAR